MLRKALEHGRRRTCSHELEASGLRGRGGAGFPMGKKASFLPKGDMDKYLVCNADESEPGHVQGPRADAEEPAPAHRGHDHRRLRGRAPTSAFIYIRGEYDYVADILDAALAEARAAGYLGERILGSGTRSLVVHRGAGAYICGEETALLDSLEGKRGNPRLKPPFPAIQGLYQGPTLINNVETLTNVPIIIAHGRRGVREDRHGDLDRHEGRLVSGSVQRPGNYEIVLGMPVARDHLRPRRRARPRAATIKFWFPGGSSAPVLPGTDEYLDLPYDFDSMAKAGSMLGSGAIIVVDDSIPIVDVALKMAKFYRHESCGKCTPCREGTNWTVKMLERIDSRRGHADGPRHHGRRSRTRSSATACACSATRWRCRSAR